MKLFGLILFITMTVFVVGGGYLFGVFPIGHQHEYGEWQTRTPATCTEDGIEFRVCECGEAEETRPITSLGHSYETVVTAPTCTEGGYTTYTCTCGHSFTGDETTATGHSHKPVVTEPTCTEGGYTTYICDCGDQHIIPETDALGHDFSNEVATEKYLATNNCGEKATYYKSCHCGEAGEETFEYGEVLSHDYYVAEVFMPNCTEGGYSTYKCRTCGDSYIGDELPANGHTYGAIVTAPKCTEGGYTRYQCACGDFYIDDEVDALGHNMVSMSDDTHHWTECDRYSCPEATEKVAHSAASISAVCNKTEFMEKDVLSASDLTVTATCECGKTYTVTEGITLENNTLTIGENTVTVSFGTQTTTVTVNAVKFNKVLNGTIKDDTYVSSSNKSDDLSNKTEMGTRGNMFRVYFRVNLSEIIKDAVFSANSDNAKVQLTLAVTTLGGLNENTIFTLKTYSPLAGVTDIDFSEINWNAIDNKPGEDGAPNGVYHQLHWNNGVQLVSDTAGYNIAWTNDTITITLTYGEIKDYIDASTGNILFAFAVDQNTSGMKIGSMENSTDKQPKFNVILNDDHFHAYTKQVADEKYLVSANCEEKAKYYYSCTCGEASTATFEYGDVIEHIYGEFVETQAPTCTVEGVNTKTCGKCGDTQTDAIPVIAHSYNTVVTAPTCTEAGYTTYTCSCGHTYIADEVEAKGHTYGEWLHDESYHWQACSCGDIINKDTHNGGEATENEQAICDTCKQPYGGLASHVHNHSAVVTAPTCTEAGYTTYTCSCGDVYVADEVAATGHAFGDWESASPATCDKDEVLIRRCDCGASETKTGTAAFGHDMQTKFNENNHWTECAHNCGTSTDPEAHFGGEATETEQATCEGCGQKYGELKPEEKDVTINGSIVEDTYITSDGSNSGKNFSTKEENNCNNGKNFRPLFKFSLASVLNDANFNKDTAKVSFTFGVSTGAELLKGESTKYSVYGFLPGKGVSDVDFSTVTWATNKEGGTYEKLYRKDTNANCIFLTQNTVPAALTIDVAINEVDGKTYITYTFDYSLIEQFICKDAGETYGYLVMGFDFNQSIKFASMESKTYAAPAVSVTYTK